MEYLLKASTVIFIFYICYKLFLQRETFFKSNRLFLLVGLVTAVIFPFIVIPVYIEYVPVVQNIIVSKDVVTQTSIEKTFNFSQLLYLIYGVGTLFFLIKLGVEFTSLWLLLKKNKTSKIGGFTFIETHKNVPPFSFFKYIVYNKTQFDDKELSHIINHEKVHAKQYHSFDILFVQFSSAFFWFNPFIWLYKKELQQNLEFIADKEAQNISKCEKSYQTLLLKSSVPNYQLALANNFYNSLIKKRIVMLHKSKSNKLNLLKYALVLPLLAIFLMNANTKEIYVEKTVTAENQASLADPSVEHEFNNMLNTTESNKANSKTESYVVDSKNKSLNQSKPNAQKTQKIAKVVNDHEMVVITKDFTDADLESLKNKLNKRGVTVKFKGIKRNSKNEITAIKIEVSSKKSNANYNTESNEPINPIQIGFDSEGGNLSIGNTENVHISGDHAFAFVSKDGVHKIHSTGNDDNIFVISGDDSDEKVEKIVIRKTDKEHVAPNSKSKVKFISEDGNVTEINDENIVVWESKTGDVDTIHVKKMSKEKAVWVNKTDSEDVYAIENGDDNTFFISTGNGKTPLYILNGKEISKEEMDAIKPDSIEKVEVLKGESATKKYGEKGENGVILITTKDKK